MVGAPSWPSTHPHHFLPGMSPHGSWQGTYTVPHCWLGAPCQPRQPPLVPLYAGRQWQRSVGRGHGSATARGRPAPSSALRGTPCCESPSDGSFPVGPRHHLSWGRAWSTERPSCRGQRRTEITGVGNSLGHPRGKGATGFLPHSQLQVY